MTNETKKITVTVRDLTRTDAGTYNGGCDMAPDLFDRRTGPVGLDDAIEWFEDLGYRRAIGYACWGVVMRGPETGGLVSLTQKGD